MGRQGEAQPRTRQAPSPCDDKFRKSLSSISHGAMVALQPFPWPGNFRQPKNAVQLAVLVSSGRELLKEHLPVCVRQPAFALSPFPNS